MFKKIRNRILVLNMAMVSAVVIVAFVVVFAIMYTRTKTDNRNKLFFGAPAQHMTLSQELIYPDSPIRMGSGRNVVNVAGYTTLISPNAGMSFSILADSYANVVQINSMIDLDSGNYTRMATKAIGSGSDADTITLDGRTWQYFVSQVTVSSAEATAPGGAAILDPMELNYIRFLDVTDSYRTLRSLALMLSGLILVVLAVFFLISRYFADKAIAPMKEAWEKQNRFIADASHELRTPLSVINANCGVLYAGQDETVESQLKWVDNITRSSDRMSGLVDSLLSLSGVTDSQFELLSASFDFSGEILAAASEIEAVACEKDLIINKDVPPDIAIESDKEHIRKILSILLDNAVKYANDGGEVSISLRREKRHAICTVRNSGEGIPPDDLPRVFDRFYRGDPARSSTTGGYGLGLAIAKGIADQLGAALSARSEQGEYAEFELVL